MLGTRTCHLCGLIARLLHPWRARRRRIGHLQAKLKLQASHIAGQNKAIRRYKREIKELANIVDALCEPRETVTASDLAAAPPRRSESKRLNTPLMLHLDGMTTGTLPFEMPKL